jgi:hypothetical protein
MHQEDVRIKIASHSYGKHTGVGQAHDRIEKKWMSHGVDILDCIHHGGANVGASTAVTSSFDQCCSRSWSSFFNAIRNANS